jgi:hypothetical protein
MWQLLCLCTVILLTSTPDNSRNIPEKEIGKGFDPTYLPDETSPSMRGHQVVHFHVPVSLLSIK